MVAEGVVPASALKRLEHFGDTTMSFTKGCEACNCKAAQLCSRCGVQRVCSSECQRKLWEGHKARCKAASKVWAAGGPFPPPVLEYSFRVDGEDELPIPTGITLFAVKALVEGLEVGKVTGALLDTRAIESQCGTDPVSAMSAAWGSSENEMDVMDVSRRLFTWGTGKVRDFGPQWPPTAGGGGGAAKNQPLTLPPPPGTPCSSSPWCVSSQSGAGGALVGPFWGGFWGTHGPPGTPWRH